MMIMMMIDVVSCRERRGLCCGFDAKATVKRLTGLLVKLPCRRASHMKKDDVSDNP